MKIFHGAPLDQSLKIVGCLNNLVSTLLLSVSKDYDIIFQYLRLARETYEEKTLCNTEEYANVILNFGETNLVDGWYYYLIDCVLFIGEEDFSH